MSCDGIHAGAGTDSVDECNNRSLSGSQRASLYVLTDLAQLTDRHQMPGQPEQLTIGVRGRRWDRHPHRHNDPRLSLDDFDRPGLGFNPRPADGQGDASISYSVAVNPVPSPRSGSVAAGR